AVRSVGGGRDISLAGGWIEVAHVVQPAATSWSVCSPRVHPLMLSSWEPICGGQRRDAARAIMVLLSLHGLAAARSRRCWTATWPWSAGLTARVGRAGRPAPGAGGSGWGGLRTELEECPWYASQIRQQGALSDPDL